MSAGAGNLKTAELVPIDKNVGQVVVQNELQEAVRGRSDRPSVFRVVIHNQPVCGGCVPEFSVVVGVPSGTILDTVNMVVVMYHLMQQRCGNLFNGTGQGSGSYVDLMGAAQLRYPGIFPQREMPVGFGGGLVFTFWIL